MTSAVSALIVRQAARAILAPLNFTFANSGANPVFAVGGAGALSLPDGRYSLTINASQVSGAGGNMAGNFVLSSALAPNPPTNIFRFFGDVTGDGAVSAADFSG